MYVIWKAVHDLCVGFKFVVHFKLAGVTVGDPVLKTGKPLSVELGPGMRWRLLLRSAEQLIVTAFPRHLQQHLRWNSATFTGYSGCFAKHLHSPWYQHAGT